LDELERIQALRVFMEWIEYARLSESPRISVVLPTRNRATFLPMAVASVQAQSYANWELLIVDDSSDDETPERLAALDDPRIRSFRVPHAGSSAARNAALDQATGDIIAYLDDDNMMHHLWLKSVAWAFDQRPNVDVLYGAIILDDVERVNQRGSGSFAKLFFRSYDRKVLLNENLADMGAIAHRARLPGARFDESLVIGVDWDLLCRLTADRDPLVLPAIACFYFTDAPNRISGGTTRRDADHKTVRHKHAQEGV
jgi:glycosyltransferase involved in cell wall biosynthesis